jgi:16S rRNA (adenine1518-N6/adenine1519-N6)-dimethyltransferase
MNSPRQTVSYLIQRFREVGLQPDARHGQNFLIDLNLVRLLADAAEIGPEDVVLEVGTGTGSLTAMLAERAGAVVTVEIDAHLHQLAAEVLIDFSNITMLQQDALKNKNRFAPEVLQAVQERLAQRPERRLKLAANLPYRVATPVISNLLHVHPLPVSMTMTIQKELADRITASPRTKQYSALSIWIQSQCETEIVRVLPPTVFWPRPQVESAILQIRPIPEKRAQIPDPVFFHNFVRAMFFHRRKFLRSELLSALKNQLDKPAVDRLMLQQGLDGKARAEELDVTTMLALAEAVRQQTDQTGRKEQACDSSS